MRTGLAAPALLALLVLVGGCGDDGRELREPTAEVTATTVQPAKVEVANPPAGSDERGDVLALSSPVFVEGSSLPERYSCTGANVPPPLAWSGVPAGTVELAITVTDPDADGFIHWVIAGIDPSVTALTGDGVPEGAIEARNDQGELGWFGPCPPAGGPHRYVFTLHALSVPSAVEPEMDGADAVAAIAATPGQATTLTATYSTS